jgi:curved DNA-binding protein CbpA
MSVTEHQLTKLKQAYQVIGVPPSASAPSIKQAYHRLAKRWHPDLCPSGTPAQADATQMMKLINEAYSTIAHAPLRYHIESYPRAREKRSQSARPGGVDRSKDHADTLPINDRREFWLRFACGALLGAFMSISVALDFCDEPKALIVSTGGLMVVCGFAAARYGDRFWTKIVEY